MSKADAIINKYEELERTQGEEVDGRTAALKASLLQEYEDNRDKFLKSALKVRVRALTETEIASIDERVQAGTITEEMKPHHQISVGTLAPKMTPEQSKKLSESIGGQQATKIWNAIFRAVGEQPQVSAAFLRRAS